ncbi:hypothetical protein C0991_006284 [Blastosporella zonata]|nr:hypothetical protein C0991_006284 [Blastosporella zonata]
MVSVLEIVTSTAAGIVGDIIGRKGTMFVGGVVFTIGGAVQTFSTVVKSMAVGRVVSGFGVGLLSLLLFILQLQYFLAFAVVSAVCHRGVACGRILADSGKPTLIDTDKDDEGMRVLADLHGGDLDNPAAQAEFREIKVWLIHMLTRNHSENTVKEGPTLSCGGGINVVFFSLCLRKRLLSW